MFHSLSSDETLIRLGSFREGLDDASIELKRREHGWNELPHKKKSLIFLFLRQFQDILVYILIVALFLSIALRVLEGSGSWEENVDIGAILAILILNAVLGFVQEYRAGKALESLQDLTSPHARVRRAGREMLITSRELVPGDIVIVEAGDRISADGRILELSHAEADESSLTGESLPAGKTSDAVPREAGISDQKNMLFAGTLVTRGSAEYVVTSIGKDTQIGTIATLVTQSETPPTPLENRMKHFSALIGAVVVPLSAALAVLQWNRGEPALSVVLLGVSLAVSAVPEGLPAVVTACLAMGVKRMAAKNALVMRLDALETLGSVNIICSDKTGTITENKMKVTEIWVAEGESEKLLVQIAISCNRASLPNLGDPTEIGLLHYAKGKGIERLDIDEETVPFSSELKYMQTRHGPRLFMKGAPEKIVALCDHCDQAEVLAQTMRMAGNGLRVLAMAMEEKGELRLIGLMGMQDPPRKEVMRAMRDAASAGIRTVMITGDNVDTASAIARKVGIKGHALDGAALDRMTPEQLKDAVQYVSIYARVSPQHKIDILKALQSHGNVVAMTGDGVNDAPALKAAHVGIAMGRDGTQVAREAASLVLTDDNYATIVMAIREGRRIYDNIRKFILYLVRANLGQMALITLTVIMGLPLPLLPVHLLWINLMTDGLPALALGMENEEPGIMQRQPRRQRESLFAGEWPRLLLGAILACGLTFLVYLKASTVWFGEENLPKVRAIVFTFSILFEILLAFTSRSSRPLWTIGFFSNKWLLGAVLIPLLLQVGILLSPPTYVLFDISPITIRDWAVILGVAVAGFMALECFKLAAHQRRRAA